MKATILEDSILENHLALKRLEDALSRINNINKMKKNRKD